VRMTVTNSTERRTTMSEQTTKLLEVANGMATYSSEVTEGGSLAMTILWTVKPDGVYARQKGAGADDKPQLQIPAVITPGKTWTAKENYMIGGVAATTVTTNRIVGFEKVKTARGPFNALVVESKGTFNQAGKKPGQIDTKTWLVRDIGTVRVEMTLRTPKSKQPVKLVSEIQ